MEPIAPHPNAPQRYSSSPPNGPGPREAGPATRVFLGWLLGLLCLAVVTVPVAVEAAPQMVCTKGTRVNLREGPGLKHAVSWEVYQHMPLIVEKRQGEWLQVKDVDEDRHWVYAPLVTANQDCVTVNNATANVRSGPATSYHRLFTVKRYTSFERLRTEGSWVELRYQGHRMWVHADLVWPAPS